ncbi:MAG: helix-turn-helix transcriptional regulator [Candidatus Pedobacter colombiensis]|uniref:Helix-turn-helix transcriptional regulator n=1 Tax=Candidatus Pedobacter colombiensis TaxID=3121371 RepID=A0AAJ5W6H4_9SPHI|nr:helix-turn-helix transcriptional regulator [Pedobacter sp.]WEK17879.1 MAG: helix-turn-helix transcriptional regulator [Pedobacter sp.]
MEQIENKHIGRNIQAIRKLRGIKQIDFANEMGVNQQNISRMENNKRVSEEKLEQASKILEASVSQIKDYDQKSITINNNVFSNDQINNPITEVIEYFKGALDERDQEIERLKEQLSRKNTRTSKTPAPIKAQLKKA